MKKLLFALPALMISGLLTAQPDTDYTRSADSDPAATAILERVKAKYDGFTSLEAEFTLQIEFPEEPVEEQKGKMIQQGDKYRVDLPSQSIICNGKSVWLYLPNNQEVQINNADLGEEDGMLSPTDLLQAYESGDYVYVLANEFMENGVAVQQIEFKPTDRNAEYTKLRLTIEKSTNQILRMKAFARDGSRFTLILDRITPNKKFSADRFEWQTSECPDCYVEDLRID